MHKEMAGFFEPFSACGRLANHTQVTENCIPWYSYTEEEDDLNSARLNAFALGYLIPPGGISGQGNFRSAIENRLQPSTCTPGARAEFYLNRYPDGSCEMGQSVVHALALACALGEEPIKLDGGSAATERSAFGPKKGRDVALMSTSDVATTLAVTAATPDRV
jgi:hypothetical protein